MEESPVRFPRIGCAFRPSQGTCRKFSTILPFGTSNSASVSLSRLYRKKPKKRYGKTSPEKIRKRKSLPARILNHRVENREKLKVVFRCVVGVDCFGRKRINQYVQIAKKRNLASCSDREEEIFLNTTNRKFYCICTLNKFKEPDEFQRIKYQIEILEHCEFIHPNLLCLSEIIDDFSKDTVFIVYEYLEHSIPFTEYVSLYAPRHFVSQTTDDEGSPSFNIQKSDSEPTSQYFQHVRAFISQTVSLFRYFFRKNIDFRSIEQNFENVMVDFKSAASCPQPQPSSQNQNLNININILPSNEKQEAVFPSTQKIRKVYEIGTTVHFGERKSSRAIPMLKYGAFGGNATHVQKITSVIPLSLLSEVQRELAESKHYEANAVSFYSKELDDGVDRKVREERKDEMGNIERGMISMMGKILWHVCFGNYDFGELEVQVRESSISGGGGRFSKRKFLGAVERSGEVPVDILDFVIDCVTRSELVNIQYLYDRYVVKRKKKKKIKKKKKKKKKRKKKEEVPISSGKSYVRPSVRKRVESLRKKGGSSYRVMRFRTEAREDRDKRVTRVKVRVEMTKKRRKKVRKRKTKVKRKRKRKRFVSAESEVRKLEKKLKFYQEVAYLEDILKEIEEENCL